jgi:2,3-bisphosphoglycerate-independent phosphoglycerate mutase
MSASLLPPPSGNLKEDCDIRVNMLVEKLPKHDCFYIHLKGPDEPGHDGDCYRKTAVISAIDKYFFGHLLGEISLKECIICVTSDHATPCSLKFHSDTPVPVLISGGKVKADKIVKFCEKECAKGSLGVLESGFMLMPKLMKARRK